MTIFGEITQEKKERFLESLNDIHNAFKKLIVEHRPQVDIDQVATGSTYVPASGLNMRGFSLVPLLL